MVVHRRVGAAARRAGKRQRAHAMPFASDQQLRAGSDEGRVSASHAEHEAGRELLAQHAEHRRRVIRARRMHLHFTGEHDLLDLLRPDHLHRSRDRRFVVLGGHRAREQKAPGRRRVQHGQPTRLELLQAPVQAREQVLGCHRRGERRQREPHNRVCPAGGGADRPLRFARPARSTSGTVSDAGSKPAQCGAEPPSAANAKPPTATGPPPSGSSVGSATAAAETSRQRSATVAKRSGPAAWKLIASPSPATAERPRSGCSNTNHCSSARREPHTTADGSTSSGTGREIVASVAEPLRRACRTASSRRAASRSRSAR